MIAVYTFIGIWTGENIRSMGITLGVVGGIWVSIAILIIAGVMINHDEKLDFIAPVSVRISNFI